MALRQVTLLVIGVFVLLPAAISAQTPAPFVGSPPGPGSIGLLVTTREVARIELAAGFKAVGLAGENANKQASDGQLKKTTATATGPAGASENGLKGLCTAYLKGGLGQDAQAKGTATPAASPLARIEKARGSESVADFCGEVLTAGNESPNAPIPASGNQGGDKAFG